MDFEEWLDHLVDDGNGKLVFKAESVDNSDKSGIMMLENESDNLTVRKWYIEQSTKIPDLIDKSASLEHQAKQACELRNALKYQVRRMMSDKLSRQQLDLEDPIKSFEQILNHKINDKHMTLEEAYDDIISTSRKTRKSVNRKLGLE